MNLQSLPAFQLNGLALAEQKRKLGKARAMYVKKFPGSTAPSVETLLSRISGAGSGYVPDLESVIIKDALYQITNDLQHFKEAWGEAEIPMREDAEFEKLFNVVGKVTETESDDDTVLLEFQDINAVEVEDGFVNLESSGSNSIWLPVTCLRRVGGDSKTR